MDIFTFILEIIGTVAFASSGAMLAIEKKMDIFGVNILGATTAVGGGIMRDVILGVTPPTAFAQPVYILFAIITSTLLFAIVYTNPDIIHSKIKNKFYLIFYADNWIKEAYNPDGQMGTKAFVGVSNNITGPYEHITYLEGAGCDTNLFEDENGKTYAIMPFGEMYIQEVDLTGIEDNNIRLIGERKMIVSADNSDVGKNFDPDYMEGPWMTKKDGKYILYTGSPYRKKTDPEFVHDLEEGYWVGTATADNIWGPYKKEPQVFLGGHIAIFEGPDGKEWFSYRGEAGGICQGLLNIDPVTFNEEGAVIKSPPTVGSKTITYMGPKDK